LGLMGFLKSSTDILRQRRHQVILGGIGLGIYIVILWQTAIWTRRLEVRRIKQEARESLNVYVGDLQSELDKFKALPLILSRDPLFIELVSQPVDERLLRAVNRELERVNNLAETSAIYILDKRGITIASSNWRGPVSFVGEDLSFRPYFQQAIKGKPGHYFALGTTSKVRGYYFSAPIFSGEEVVGIITVKVQLHRLEKIWCRGSEKVVVTDPHGVIFITSYPPWKFCSLGPIDRETTEALRRSRRYGNFRPKFLCPVPVDFRDGSTRLIHVKADMLPASERPQKIGKATVPFLLQSHGMQEAGWTVHILSNLSRVDERVRDLVLLCGSLLLTFFLASLLLYHRSQARRERELLEKRSREALEEANRMLEQRVRERTRALTETNTRLRMEIEERQRTETELRTTQEGLIQAGKLAAIGQMAAGITHEINQPLSALRMFADNALVFLERGEYDQVRANLKNIVELVEKMAEITLHLKSFARKSPGKNAPVPVVQVVKNALMLLETQIRKREIQVDLQGMNENLLAWGNQVRLEQVMVNILKNGMDAVSRLPVRRLFVTIQPLSDRILILVRDTGPGIAPEDMNRLFEPFFSRKADGKGLGLGLSLSLAIVEDFGGTIRVANHPEGGAVVTVELRRYTAEGKGG